VNNTGSNCSNDELDRSEHGTDDTEHHERGDLQRSQLQRRHSMAVHTTRGSARVRNTPHAQIELIENSDDVHTDDSPHRIAPHPV